MSAKEKSYLRKIGLKGMSEIREDLWVMYLLYHRAQHSVVLVAVLRDHYININTFILFLTYNTSNYILFTENINTCFISPSMEALCQNLTLHIPR